MKTKETLKQKAARGTTGRAKSPAPPEPTEKHRVPMAQSRLVGVRCWRLASCTDPVRPDPDTKPVETPRVFRRRLTGGQPMRWSKELELAEDGSILRVVDTLWVGEILGVTPRRWFFQSQKVVRAPDGSRRYLPLRKKSGGCYTVAIPAFVCRRCHGLHPQHLDIDVAGAPVSTEVQFLDTESFLEGEGLCGACQIDLMARRHPAATRGHEECPKCRAPYHRGVRTCECDSDTGPEHDGPEATDEEAARRFLQMANDAAGRAKAHREAGDLASAIREIKDARRYAQRSREVLRERD